MIQVRLCKCEALSLVMGLIKHGKILVIIQIKDKHGYWRDLDLFLKEIEHKQHSNEFQEASDEWDLLHQDL